MNIKANSTQAFAQSLTHLVPLDGALLEKIGGGEGVVNWLTTNAVAPVVPAAQILAPARIFLTPHASSPLLQQEGWDCRIVIM